MASDDLAQAPLQRRDVEETGPPDRQELVVERQVRSQLGVKPDLLLLMGQRDEAPRRAAPDRARPGPRPLPVALQILLEQSALDIRELHGLRGRGAPARSGGGLRPPRRAVPIAGTHAAAPNDTGSVVRPRSPRFVRHTSGPGSSVRLGSRRSIVSKATCPSIRARAAPKQK